MLTKRMDTEDLVDTLEEAELSPYEAKAYVALLERGQARATTIADASGVPLPRIYDVLERLESRGYAETFEQEALRARANTAMAVKETLRDRAQQFEQAAGEVEDRWQQPELTSNETSIVERYQTVRQRARKYIENAEFQVQLCLSVSEYERLRPVLAEVYERGVSIRIVVHGKPDEERPDPESFEGVCVEARYRQIPSPFVVVVDREISCFAHNPATYDPYGVLVNDRTHTYIIHWYFLTCLWENWEPIYTGQSEGLPLDYLEIRQLVRDLEPLLACEATVQIRIEGNDLETGEQRTLTGTVEETKWVGEAERDESTPHQSGQVSLLLDTDDGRVTVGGWAATLEEIEATRITVLDVVHPDDAPEQLLGG